MILVCTTLRQKAETLRRANRKVILVWHSNNLAVLDYPFLLKIQNCTSSKEIVERRHGETIKFLFLPKMGLLGSLAGNEKNAGCEL